MYSGQIDEPTKKLEVQTVYCQEEIHIPVEVEKGDLIELSPGEDDGDYEPDDHPGSSSRPPRALASHGTLPWAQLG